MDSKGLAGAGLIGQELHWRYVIIEAGQGYQYCILKEGGGGNHICYIMYMFRLSFLYPPCDHLVPLLPSSNISVHFAPGNWSAPGQGLGDRRCQNRPSKRHSFRLL